MPVAVSAGDGAGLDPALLRADRRAPRAGPAGSSRLPGGLTNQNYKVTTPDGAYVRPALGAIVRRRAGRRPPGRVREQRPRRRRRGRRTGGRLPARGRHPRRSGSRGARPLTDEHLQRARDAAAGWPTPVADSTPASAVRQRLRHVRAPARAISAAVLRRGFRLPAGYLDSRRGGATGSAAPWPSAGGRRWPATTICWPPTSSTTADRIWIIDYEYSGNNDPYFELGNIWSECHLTRRPARGAGRGLRRQPVSEPPGPRPPVGPDVAVRLDAVGVHPGRAPAPSTSTSGAGGWRSTSGPRPRSRGPDLERLLADVTAGRLSRARTDGGGRPVGDEPTEVPYGRELPDRARVVVIGGGVDRDLAPPTTWPAWAGPTSSCSNRDSCRRGTTWHAAGLLGQLRATECGTRLVQYSARLYGELEAETGLATGLKRCGGVTVARTPDRMVQLRRTAATAEVYDLECELITPAQAQERYPILETGRPARRPLAARRRHGQPGRRDRVAGPRGPHRAASASSSAPG